MELAETLKTLFMQTAQSLSGAARRLFMARTVKTLGRGGAQQAEQQLGWNRGTIRKGMHELQSGLTCLDAYAQRGRRRAEEHLPQLLDDVRDWVDCQSQTDPRFKSERLYTRLSAAAVQHQLIQQKGYRQAALPTRRTLSTKLHQLGYTLQRVQKCQPQKKIPETDAIFAQVHQVNAEADASDQALRLSLDAKAAVKIGAFSREGLSRVSVKAADHDFKPERTVTPFGCLLPRYGDLFVYYGTSKVTSDFSVDNLADLWFNTLRLRFPAVQMLVLNQDNGPENHSRRTQSIKRLMEFAVESGLTIRLAYYPPYHSKYHAIERCWGVLERHWNGVLLDDLNTVLKFTESMTWKGPHPIVKLIDTIYQTGVSLTHAAMQALEQQIERLPGLQKWFVDITAPVAVGFG